MPPRPSRPAGRIQRYFPWVAGTLALLISGLLGYVLWTLKDLPDPGQAVASSRSIIVYDRKGREIQQISAEGAYHHDLKLSEMGKLGPVAMLAAEDRNFYHHGAIDYTSTARAAFEDIAHRQYAQGGSTITQQLVKIQVLNPQKSVFRKMQEALLATALEQRYSKDQILEMYLNRVFFGHNAYGLGAASQIYFGAGKQPKDLTAGQAAFLTGLVNGPSYYDPQLHYERAKARQLYVLDGMVKTGVLTADQAQQAAQEDIKSELKFDQSLLKSRAPHFVQYVLAQLEKTLGADTVQHGGFSVYTTLDLDLQDLAQRSVSTGVGKLKNRGVNNGDLLAARPDTGEILAWVGSADFYNDSIAGQVDVIQAPRQPGSSFKPYVFEAALRDKKITLATTLHDRPTDFGNGFKPPDFDNRFMGDISARRSLLLSRNVPAVEAGQLEGMDNVISLAHSMGIKSQLKPFLSTAIGASEVTMLEHLQGYQTFANQGSQVPLIGITKITDSQGYTLFGVEPGKQPNASTPISPAEAYLITDTLKDYPQQWSLGWRRTMAGKSGTTGGSTTGVHNDAWMMAYNPNIVVGAWGGNTAPNGGGGTISAFGTEVGQQILAPFINGLPSNMRDWYKQPAGITTGSGCRADRPSGGREIFLAGTEQGVNCAPVTTPTPTAAPTSTPTPVPTSAFTPVAPSALPSATPTPRRTPTPTPRPSAGVRPAGTPTPAAG
ncbi:transglycosylase domain-containing protein [Candidatus Nephthysia bennettiae]|uniref:Transglycosylase domain-containing protein n=1 Tax=Candidatus Nephthysia bennettiae TaxID=3127016 RepID=A0A934K1Q9_9BACT|nr:transglycosylase domain-containing protein [Candidatus Dormibacteraeota bacterium]MBJ7610896.1 transglycosylase domain-containing protein [Candidatus Dormibacteraeota bacterium]